jgi:hypothetical protein
MALQRQVLEDETNVPSITLHDLLQRYVDVPAITALKIWAG